MSHNRGRKLLEYAIAIACLPASMGFSRDMSDPNALLKQRLAAISAEHLEDVSDLALRESQCLALVHDFNSPAQKGSVYARIAEMYSEKGFRSRKDPRIPKAYDYCMKALEYPLDSVTACQMYSRLAGSLMAGCSELPQETFVPMRQQAAIACLKGLKVALDSNVPQNYPPPPVVNRYEAMPGTPDYEKQLKKHQEELSARNRWEFQEKLFMIHRDLVEQCVTLYSRQPHDMEGANRLMSEQLAGHPREVEILTAKIRLRIGVSPYFKL